MIRRILQLLALLLLAAVLLIVVGVVALRPPAALEVPVQGAVVADVTVVNPGGKRRAHQTLTVRGGYIESIADGAGGGAEPETACRFAGRYVLPGLIDMHVHHPFAMAAGETELFSLMYLAHGVTTVRDTGNFDGSILTTRQRIRDGAFPGPRIFACGPILDGDPPFWPNSRVVKTAADARDAVAEVAAQGVDCIKVYNNITTAALTAIREAAAQHGLPVIGHVPLEVPFEAAHLADVQHLTGVPPATQATDATERFHAFIKGWHDLDAARIDFIVRTSVEQRIVHTPTIVVLDHIARLVDYAKQRDDPVARLLPRYYRDIFWNPAEDFRFKSMTPDGWTAFADMFNKTKTIVRRLHEAGVRVHVGTDTMNPFVLPGVSVHEELRLFVDAGFTTEEAWVAATRWPGEFLREPQLGTLAPGAPADFLIFREDPTRDLSALSTLKTVVAQGRLYPRPTLDQALARYAGHFQSSLYETVSMRVARFMIGLQFRDRQ